MFFFLSYVCGALRVIVALWKQPKVHSNNGKEFFFIAFESKTILYER
jgi:hypothetical protein